VQAVTPVDRDGRVWSQDHGKAIPTTTTGCNKVWSLIGTIHWCLLPELTQGTLALCRRGLGYWARRRAIEISRARVVVRRPVRRIDQTHLEQLPLTTDIWKNEINGRMLTSGVMGLLTGPHLGNVSQ
jgi:hypothetical protein